MPDDGHRVHNRFKLPFVLVCFVGGVALAIGGAVAGHPELVAPGAVAALGTAPAIWVILTRRGNPWWMRSPLDPPSSEGSSDAWQSERGAFLTGRGGKVLYGLTLVGSIGFVVAGIALVVDGAVTGRGYLIFVGALSGLFFGACASVAAAILRRSV